MKIFPRFRRTVNSRLKIVSFLFISVWWLSGCAATSTFTNHPAKIDPLIATIQSGQSIDLDNCLLSERRSSDGLLYDMERGRLAQILGKADISVHDFSSAAERIGQNDEKARVSLSDLGANTAAVEVNNNAVPYEGAGYERVMLHHYQALNYLKRNDLEGAGVEVRIANIEQEEALKQHEEEVGRALKEAKEQKVHRLMRTPAITNAYAEMDEVAGKVKNSFQNAYTFYLSGFIYEAMQEPNDAYIDYKRALEIYPENGFLQKDVLRLAKELGITENPNVLKPGSHAAPNPLNSDGDLLVLFEDEFIPRKTQVNIPINIPHLGLLAVAFPVYRTEWTPPRPLTIEADGTFVGKTEPICDFRSLAVKALKEDVPVIATRQLVRLVSKGATANMVRQRLGLIGVVWVSLWNVAGENADLRSWNSLPANAQVLRAALPAGRHRLTILPEGASVPVTVVVRIAEGSRNILHVIRAGQELYTSFIPLRRDKSSAASTPPPVEVDQSRSPITNRSQKTSNRG
ncbi:MAG TPA: hypothetical protein VMJ66_06145 [Geobacteraceae bacterium]|nr:hypothetical protein [Geobacteraceae bacterium]